MNTVHQANATLHQASAAMASLDLLGLSFRWRMVHLGQGLYARGDGTTPHVHKHIHLESCLSGQFRFGHDAGSVLLKPGQLLLVAPNRRHLWKCTQPGFMIGGLIDVAGAERENFLKTLQARDGGVIVIKPASCMTWQRELLRMLAEHGSISWRVSAISSVLKLLLIDLLEAIVDLDPWRPSATARKETVETRAKAICGQALEFIEANYSHPIQLQDVALQIGISPRHLNRLYRRVHGDSVGATLQQLRLERAHRRLREYPEDLIKSVAYDCGFSSPAYFTACYRETFGCLPSEDRHARV